MDISKIDKNFTVKTSITEKDLCFYDIGQEPFSVYGVIYENGFCRMPQNVAQKVSENVAALSRNSTGGRLRFATNSAHVAICAEIKDIAFFPHMPLSATAGFDLYVDGVFSNSFMPPIDIKTGYDSILYFNPNKQTHQIEIYFPLYSSVTDLKIGLSKSAEISEAKAYRPIKPVVFYGSSITQGACASRPGLSYQGIISRKYNCDTVNLGFSGNALGEQAMAEYINTLEMSAFVCDYDYNAPNAQHLEATHYNFYKTIREKNPALPIILVSRPNFKFNAVECTERRSVIQKTYSEAIASGDKNIYYIDGETLWGSTDWDCCSVDTTHPNDLGLFRMSKVIGEEILKILNLSE